MPGPSDDGHGRWRTPVNRQSGTVVSAAGELVASVLGAGTLWFALGVVAPVVVMPGRLLDPVSVAALCWGGQLWYVGRSVSEDWRSLLGAANTVTLARGALYSVVAGFVVVPPDPAYEWVPALAYGGGVVLDKLDGTVARTVGRETDAGRRLDMAFDTFGLVAAPLVAVLWGRLPVWYLSASVAKYAYRAGVAYRGYRGRPVYALPESRARRLFAALQMVFVAVALVPAVPTALVGPLAPVVLLPFLGGFLRDYLAVSGRIQ